VTIFGESAGAGSMTTHLVNPQSWSLFQAVALESGSFAEWTTVSLSCAQGNYDLLLEKTGCHGVKCLQALPAKLLKDLAGSNSGVSRLLIDFEIV
jgi:carboxylesterase type B